MKKFVSIVSALATLLIIRPTYAELIDFDTYTTDTESGLDWLDVYASSGRTYSEVSSQLDVGGNFEGWRYATRDEFLGFTNNRESYGLSILLGYHNSHPGSLFDYDFYYNYFTAGMLLNYDEDHNIGYISSYYNENEPAYSGGPRYASYPTVVKSYTFEDGLACCDLGYYTDPDYPEDLELAHHVFYSELGSFLVRGNNMSAVPLPTAAFMFVPALIGLLGFRRIFRV